MRAFLVTGGLALLVGVGAVSSVHATASAPAPGSFRDASFDADPQWDGLRNWSRAKCAKRTFDFGWVPPRPGNVAGAIGGVVDRSSFYRAYYALVLPQPRSLDDPLTVSGVIRSSGPDGSVFVGWFNSQTSFDWRTADSLGLRYDRKGKRRRIFFAEYGTKNAFTGSASVDPPDPAPLKPWSLEYLPDGGTWGVGLLRITVDGLTAETSLKPEQRADGATFDRFGLLNVQLDGPPLTVYVSNLVVDGQAVDLTADPGWEASNSMLIGAPDCMVNERHRFGYSSGTQGAGGDPGEIGGIVWRSEGNKAPAFYGDAVGPLTLEDVLYAEGRLSLERATVDSNMFIGWFNALTDAPKDEGVPANLLAAGIGGPSEWGFRFFPVWHSSGAPRSTFSDHRNAPLLTPKRTVWRFWICYVPAADPLLQPGRLTVGLEDPGDLLPASEVTINVTKKAREAGAAFNRFGIRNGEKGGRSVTLYLDDLRYTAGPGDVGPADRCGT
jgi:hypothetical protein